MLRFRGIASASAAALTLGLSLGLLCAAGDASASIKPARSPAATAEQRGPDGSTPLQWAVYNGDAAEVKRLLRAGADVREANAYGATPMQLAAETGDVAILKLLLEAGADADSPNAEGQTALMAVARTGNVEAAKLLLKHGAKVDAVEQFGGQTALMWASARRHPEMMKLLLSKGAQINARSVVRNWERHITAEGRAKDVNTGGLTPLLYAARENCLDCVNVLLDRHVDIDLPDPDGVAPVTIAIMNGNWDVAKRLISAGCDVNQWDIYGQGPLYAAIDMGNATSGGRASIDPMNEADGKEIIRMLLDRGANPNMQLFFRPANRVGPGAGTLVSRGTTPLIRAAANDDVEVVKLLLAHGAEVNLHQADGQTATMAALGARRGGGTEEQAIEVLRVLHAAGTDVNVVAKPHHLQRVRGGTALHYAVRLGWKKAIEELVSYGADVNAKDPDGLTALDYAMARGYIPFLAQKAPVREDLAKLLRGWGATVELAKTPDWPPVGPPIGYEATIWPL
jgi:ankyrin repeat protein